MGMIWTPYMTRWADRHPAAIFSVAASVGASAFALFAVQHTAPEDVIVSAACRVDAYIGSGYYMAHIETVDGRSFRIGDTHNAHDIDAKRNAADLVNRVCTGAPVRVGVIQGSFSEKPEIIIAEPLDVIVTS